MPNSGPRMDNATLMWNNFYSTLIRSPCPPQIVLSTSRMRSMVFWLGSLEVEHIISHRCQWNKKRKVTQLDRGLGYTHSRYRVLETSLTEGESKTIAHSVLLTGIHEASFHPVPVSIQEPWTDTSGKTRDWMLEGFVTDLRVRGIRQETGLLLSCEIQMPMLWLVRAEFQRFLQTAS